MRKRYVLCGLSGRGLRLFGVPLLGPDGPNDTGTDLSEYGELVAVLDIDEDRVARFTKRLTRAVPFYRPEAFDRMVAETAPDVVLVASPDHTHAEYTVAALRAGVDVVTEKPLAATCEQVRAMLAAERESSASIRVAHNVRYAPRSRRLKQMMLDGLVGAVTNVELVWNVDTVHGSSYFTRWNRQRALSGGLSVHKSCHHLDLVGWLVDDVPEQVFAYGALRYFGPDSPHNPGADLAPTEQAARCPYYRQWEDPVLDGFGRPRPAAYGLPYPVQYPADRTRYLYDREIDIEDTYSAVLRYRGGAMMTYSMILSSPWEGYRLAINGTHGRIEADWTTLRGQARPQHTTITYYPMFGERQVHDVPLATGGHDGADPMLQRDLFAGPSEESLRLGLPADSRQGAYAVAAGEAIWRSAADNRPYAIAELVGDI
jgi:predicted dehydrogenase